MSDSDSQSGDERELSLTLTETYIVNQAAGFSQYTTEIQEWIFDSISILQGELGKRNLQPRLLRLYMIFKT